MERILRAVDVAAAIRGTLAGTRSKAQLGTWAHLAMLADEVGTVPYDRGPWQMAEISGALHHLIMMAEGPEYELEDAELQTMMERLERLDSGQQSHSPR